jgi:phosphoadenosine phosphosulfate reductase
MVEIINTAVRSPAGDHQDRMARARAISKLNDRYEALSALEIIEDVAFSEDFGRLAVVSSFGAESAVLLHLTARVRPDMPVLMIDTGKLFGETLHYRTQLQHLLGLEDIRVVAPRRAELEEHDPLGTMSATDPDQCCAIRKTSVLKRALSNFDSWLNGRKRYQSDTRSLMSIVEADGPRLKVNPLANWTMEDIRNYMIEHELPHHPLIEKGYGSIGCRPCTSKVREGADPRSGRWQGLDKTECGIHTG